ncbi:hypothetical protein COC59_24845 [Bacillus cereus]|nr:hypothetical protein COJ45_18630 [Bacillus cereus]PGS20344.1 hypothetical protein COC59_24845 [Bacillus cereus]
MVWFFGVCINESGQLLMVLQGKPEKKKMWSIPSGGKEQRETLEECCIREIKEKNGIYSRNINLSILAAFDSK